MKKIWVLGVICLLVAGLLLSSCDTENNSSINNESNVSSEPVHTDFPVKVRDYDIYQKPQKTISLSPALTEIIIEFGYNDALIARSSFCTGSEVADLPEVGTFSEPDLTQIITLRPDYILTQEELPASAMDLLKQNNIPVICLPAPTNVEELLQLYRDICTIFEGDVLDPAQLPVVQFEEALGLLKDQVAEYRLDNDMMDTDSFLYIAALPNFIATGESLESRLLEYIGFENIAAEYSGYYCPEDEIADLRPDLVIVDLNIDSETLQEDSNYEQIPAITDDSIAFVDITSFECFSPKLIDELHTIAETLYNGVTDIEISSNTSTPAE